jgi:hypothetical protein
MLQPLQNNSIRRKGTVKKCEGCIAGLGRLGVSRNYFPISSRQGFKTKHPKIYPLIHTTMENILFKTAQCGPIDCLPHTEQHNVSTRYIHNTNTSTHTHKYAQLTTCHILTSIMSVRDISITHTNTHTHKVRVVRVVRQLLRTPFVCVLLPVVVVRDTVWVKRYE